jgi:stage V sporulation protein B
VDEPSHYGGISLQEVRKQNYLKGAAILAAASIFVKIVGAIYKIPILRILDGSGKGIFQTSYNIYNLLLTISTAGIPAALSRIVSTAAATGKIKLAKRYFSVSLPAFMIIGAIATAAMLVFADAFANLLNLSTAAPGVRVLAPAVLFVCIISVYRGYAQGFENMLPTAISQVAEVICKAAFGIAVSLWLMHRNYASQIVSAGAITGTTIGLGLAIPILIWYKRRIDRTLPSGEDGEATHKWTGILGQLMKVSIPITISAAFMAIMVVIDNSVVLGRLQHALHLTQDAASEQYGLHALGLTIYNLPPTITVPIAISIIPAIAAAIAKKQANEAGSIMTSSVKLLNMIAMPAGAGISVLAAPILSLLYGETHQTAITILMILGVASFFVSLQYITTAILQANGFERVALMTFPVGAIVKIALSYILTGYEKIGVMRSSIGTLVCFIIISSLNIAFIIIKVKERPKLASVFFKPLLCTAVMAAVAFFVYKLVHRLGSSLIGTGWMASIIFLAVAIIVAVVVYVVLIIVTRTITKDDIALVPKGEKLVKLLRIK